MTPAEQCAAVAIFAGASAEVVLDDVPRVVVTCRDRVHRDIIDAAVGRECVARAWPRGSFVMVHTAESHREPAPTLRASRSTVLDAARVVLGWFGRIQTKGKP